VVVAWVGDAVRVAAAVTLIIGVSRHSICSTAISDVSWITSTRDKTTTIARCVTMYRDITKRQGSSTQTIIGNLSATTLGVSQMPSHTHGLPTWADGKNGRTFLNYTSDGNITTGWMLTGSTGGSDSHTHSITNPTHTHTAITKISVTQASRVLHYIMRTS